MSYRLQFTVRARLDIERVYQFLADKDPVAARAALKAIDRAWTMLADFPFACRKADQTNPLLREMVLSFGSSGYVALFEIDSESTVTVLALRHQREDDYH